MSTKDVIKMNAITVLDISSIDDDDYFGEEWALLHLDNDGNIKGLHYRAADDDEFDYYVYIPQDEIEDKDIIYHGYVDEYYFYANEIKFQGERYEP